MVLRRGFNRASKYGAVKTEVDGIIFASKAEATRYSELKLLQMGGKIQNLELQPKFPMIVNGIKIGTYRADFKYFDLEKKQAVVEDVKGFLTTSYRLRKRIVEAQYGVRIVEITAKRRRKRAKRK